MTATERLEFFLDQVRAATFAVPLVYLAVSGADWVTNRFFTVNTPSETYVTTAGNWVYGGALLLIAVGCLSSTFESLKKIFKGLSEEEYAEWRSSMSMAIWTDPPSMDDGAIYVTKRTWQFLGGLVFMSLLALANGRLFAWLGGNSILPTWNSLVPIAAISVFFFAMAIRSCFNFANQEARHGKMGNQISYVTGFKLYCLVPFCILYEIAGALANEGESNRQFLSMAMFVCLIAYFVFTRSMAPFTKWLDGHAQMDRMAGPPKKVKPSATPKEDEAVVEPVQLGKGIRRRRD